MALRQCPDCGAQVSSSASTCPHCGAKGPKPAKWPWIVGIPVALFGLLMLWGSTIPAYQHEAREFRDICLKLARFDARDECERLYQQKLREGREREDILAGRKAPPAAPVALPLTPEQQRRSACADNIERAKSEYEAQMKRREFKAAADGMRECAALLEDPFLQGLVSKADAKLPKPKR